MGLKGVLFAPFIHASPRHLFSNTAPLFVLSAMLLYFYRKIAFSLLFYGTFLAGLLTWVIARPAYHIGASGVIYMLVSFIFFSGIFRKYYRLVALSLLIVFLYGGMIWYIFPVKGNLSWEGHLSGFIIGLVFALSYKKVGPQKKEYHFTKTEFDTYFDEDGTFNPPQPPEDKTLKEDTQTTTNTIINYQLSIKKEPSSSK